MALPVGSSGVATTTCVPRLMFPLVGAFVVVHASAKDAPGVTAVEDDVRKQVGAGCVLETVIVLGVEVARLPAASRATATRVCCPLGTVAEFQLVVYRGPVVSSAPMSVLVSSLN